MHTRLTATNTRASNLTWSKTTDFVHNPRQGNVTNLNFGPFNLGSSSKFEIVFVKMPMLDCVFQEVRSFQNPTPTINLARQMAAGNPVLNYIHVSTDIS